jgi:hypothetical protein
MIAANNHYAGFGPGTANMFRSMVGLPEVSWTYQRQQQPTDSSLHFKNQNGKRQKRLTDFTDFIE